MNFRRRDFLKTIGAAAGSLSLSKKIFCSTTKSGEKPNIIYIMADDLGYGDLGCYGQKKIKTPNLDRMASEGMKFTQHYAGSTVCAPSRCTLMTGYHTGHARVRGNATVPLRPSDVTVAELLKQSGYSTALIGKWGLGEAGSTGIPTKQGFDYFYGYLNQIHAHNYFPEFLWRNEEKVKLKNKVNITTTGYAKGIGGVATKKIQYSHDLFMKEALNFVDKNKNNPFFLYLALTIPHANDEAPKNGMEVPDLGIYADKNWPEPQKGQAAMITRMDRGIGVLLGKLKELNIDKNTLVIFTSDNGPHREGGNNPNFADSNGPLRGIKRDLYEGGISVPLIARWPGKIKAGTKSDLISAFWDFLPTACDVAGISAPKGIDGISYLPTLLGKRQKTHKLLYWEFFEGNKCQAIRMGNFKGIYFFRKKGRKIFELYNLAKDIGEKNNIADTHPDMVAKLKKLLKESRTESKYWHLPK